MSREGKLVVLERHNEKGDGLEYGSGEYFVLRDTGNSLYAMKPIAGYEGTSEQNFLLVGTRPWKVVAESDGSQVLQRLVRDFPTFIAEKQSPKPHWVGYVYDSAARRLEELKAMLARRSVTSTTVSPDGREITITIRL